MKAFRSLAYLLGTLAMVFSTMAQTRVVTVPVPPPLTTPFLPYAGSSAQLIGDSPAWVAASATLGTTTFTEGLETLTPGANVTLNWATHRTKAITLGQNTTFAFSNTPSATTNVQRMVVNVIGNGTFTTAFTGASWQTPQVTTPSSGIVTTYYFEAANSSINGFVDPVQVWLNTAGAIAPNTAQTVNSVELPAATIISGDITPTQLTADVNDYNPTGLSTATRLRLSSDASRTITGIVGANDGRLLVLNNIGSFDIVLADESASSAATNRFALNANVTISADQGVILGYDLTSARWRVWASISSSASSADVQVFTATTNTWTKPAGKTWVQIIGVGAGGGGGSGRVGAAGSVRCGGGGGGGGGFNRVWLPASVLGATETVTALAGGTGGTSQTSDDSNGNAGASPADSTFGIWFEVGSGGGGGGGTAAAGTAGSVGTGEIAGAAAGAADGSGGGGNNGNNSTTFAGAGGGAGGGISAANAASTGGGGGTAGSNTRATALASGSAGAATGGNGGNGGSAGTNEPRGGGGGGGGGSAAAGNGGIGGNGGAYGAGGGGGAAAPNGSDSGAGGNGGNALIIAIST